MVSPDDRRRLVGGALAELAAAAADVDQAVTAAADRMLATKARLNALTGGRP